jgi:hypothetical protein
MYGISEHEMQGLAEGSFVTFRNRRNPWSSSMFRFGRQDHHPITSRCTLPTWPGTGVV